jgi:hypothetical protein
VANKGSTILLVFAFVSVITATIFLYRAIIAPRRNVDLFMKQVSTVEIGKTKLEDWRRQLAEAQISSLILPCEGQACGVGLQRENRLLRKLRLAPPTTIDASVGFKNGVANGIYILFAIAGKNSQGELFTDKGVVVSLRDDRPEACHSDYKLAVKERNGVGDRFWATVSMDSCISSVNREKALAINTACLTKIGGCTTVEDIIPEVFGRR